MRYRITHKTVYRYSESASLSQNELFLKPRKSKFQTVLSSQLKVSPPPQYSSSRVDYFGNNGSVFMVQHPHETLSMEAISLVETVAPPTLNASSTPAWESVVDRLYRHKKLEELYAYQFVFPSPMIQIPTQALDFVRNFFPPGTPVLEGSLKLIESIFNDFQYDKGATTVDTSVEQVLLNKKGVCQDFAHLAISCLRSLGLAARYISGYLETLPPPGKPKLIGADASHAWLAIFIPEYGWVDLDPTNNMIPGERHITLAWGRDYSDVTPVKGVVMGGGQHRLLVSVDISKE